MWNEHIISSRSGSSSKAADKLLEIVEEFGLSQHVKQPTRIHGNTANILDLILTNNSDIVEQMSVVDGIADHNTVIADMKIKASRKRPVKRTVTG